MSDSLTIKFETISQERRDVYAATMIAVLESMMKGADVVNFTYSNETPTMRGKDKRTKTTKWEVGQDAPTFGELGIYSTQRDMFETVPDHRTFTAPIGNGQPDHGAAVAEAEEDEQLGEQPVGLIPTEDDAEPLVEDDTTFKGELGRITDDDTPPPTVEETREALGPWAYLLDTPTEQDAEQPTDEEPAEEQSHEQDAEQQPDDQQASGEEQDDQSQAE